MINSPFKKAEPGARRKKNDVDITAELVGPRGMATDDPGINDDKRALSRHEWINVLVRIACMRYVMTGQEGEPSRAVERLFVEDMYPHVDGFMSRCHQIFRREVRARAPLLAAIVVAIIARKHVFVAPAPGSGSCWGQ